MGNKLKEEIVEAAISWFEEIRPENLTMQEHINNQTGEEKLSFSVANFLKTKYINIADLNYWQQLLHKQTNKKTKEQNTMAKDKDGKNKEQKGTKPEKEEKVTKPEKEEKAGKKEKASKKEDVRQVTAIDDSIIEGVSNAKIVKTLEDTAKLDSTPAGDYFINAPAGKIRLRKSEESGRVSWQFNDKQISRPDLYNVVKAGKVASANDDDDDDDDDDKTPPANAKLDATYKKKQLINILREGQIFKKKIINAIESSITEKKITGSAFIAAIDTATGKETDIEKINQIFEEV